MEEAVDESTVVVLLQTSEDGIYSAEIAAFNILCICLLHLGILPFFSIWRGMDTYLKESTKLE
jgi:hypothetical protein